MSSQSASPPHTPASPCTKGDAIAWQVELWGTKVPYAQGLAWQTERHALIAAEKRCDALCLLEHTRVITCGRNTVAGNVLADNQTLKAAGIELYETGRGGDVTYHGPHQLVGYPIVRLREHERDIRAYVYNLEEALILTARDFGVLAQRIDGLRGIWVGNKKLAAIGVRLSRWTTTHGFALNVATDLTDFDYIVPCGLVGRGVTSFKELLGEAPAMLEVQQSVRKHLARTLGRFEPEAR